MLNKTLETYLTKSLSTAASLGEEYSSEIVNRLKKCSEFINLVGQLKQSIIVDSTQLNNLYSITTNTENEETRSLQETLEKLNANIINNAQAVRLKST